MFIQIIATAFHSVWCFILVDVCEWGASGAGVATTFTHLITMIGLYIYTSLKLSPELKLKSWFHPFRADVKQDCFDRQGLVTFFRIGIPSTGMLCLEWWAFEVMIFMSAFISLKATAAQVITLNTAALFFMPTVGLQTAGSVLVGRSIGSMEVK